MKRDTVNKLALLLFVTFISLIFFSMIRNFMVTILLAGIFSALAHPAYRRIEDLCNGRKMLASLITMFLFTIIILLPLIGLLGIVAAQAISVGKSITPWIQEKISNPPDFFNLNGKLLPYREDILQQIAKVAGDISSFLIDTTLVTVNFIFLFFIFLYTMFFFLMDGNKLLTKILYYLPLKDQDERRMLEKFTSVTRATLKGTAVIGILQGSLAGLAFAVAGIESAIFWGTIMTILSIIPGIGSALVWIPATLILAAGGEHGAAIGLGLFCGLLVGSIDNLLRPLLVGKDTEMHELLIFLGTLGGISFFGVLGFIIGPIIAALFVIAWEIYGNVFQKILPRVANATLSELSMENSANQTLETPQDSDYQSPPLKTSQDNRASNPTNKPDSVHQPTAPKTSQSPKDSKDTTTTD